jgi:protoporphyrinogen/coproporphyrinogen III oxidase
MAQLREQEFLNDVNPECDVLVVGAGISGLTAAFYLVQRGLTVRVIDAAPRTGGVIGTDFLDGVLCERGPNSILDTAPLISELLSLLDIRQQRVETSALSSKRYIVRNGELMVAPTSPAAFMRTPLFSIGAKLRLIKEPFVSRAATAQEESVSEFVTRRLGRELLDYAVEPFVAGIYAGNPDELALAAAFPRLHALEQRHGSLIRGQIAGARERRQQAQTGERAKNAARSFSFINGMQTLTDALERAIGGVQTSTRAAGISSTTAGSLCTHLESNAATGHTRSRAIVLAVPAVEAAALMLPYAPDAARALNEIPYAPIASVVRAYDRAAVAHPLDGFGFLAPRVEKRRILGCLFSSSMFERRAPADMVVLTTFIGGRRDPQLAMADDSDIERINSDELKELIGARGSPALSAITRWPRAIPQYTLGHLERVRRAEAAQQALPGLFLCGSYREGVAVGDRIKSAHGTADAVMRFMGGVQA